MFRTSVSRLLTGIQLLMLAGLLVAVTIIAGRAWNNLTAADAVLEAARTDRALFAAIIDTHAQIAITQTALLTDAAPMAAIEAARRTSDDASTTEELSASISEISSRVQAGAAAAEANGSLEQVVREQDSLQRVVHAFLTRMGQV